MSNTKFKRAVAQAKEHLAELGPDAAVVIAVVSGDGEGRYVGFFNTANLGLAIKTLMRAAHGHAFGHCADCDRVAHAILVAEQSLDQVAGHTEHAH